MKKLVLILVAVSGLCHGEVREVRPPLNLLPPTWTPPPTLAERIEARARRHAIAERAAAMRELAGVGTNRLDSAAISNQVSAIRERGAMLQGLSLVVADTRTNMPEAASLSDVEVAGLYITQMNKSVAELLPIARSNTVEHVIGAGMRQDLRGE